jgi:hypothetical protein
MACGREAGGRKAGELGICPVSLRSQPEGVSRAAGRGQPCWAFPGNACDHRSDGQPGQDSLACRQCERMQQVCDREGRYFALRQPPRSRMDGAA